MRTGATILLSFSLLLGSTNLALAGGTDGGHGLQQLAFASPDLDVDVTRSTVDEIASQLRVHPPISGLVDYTKLLTPNTRLIMTGDLTHGGIGRFPKEFREVIRQLSAKTVRPPFKYVGMELFEQNWQSDFERYFQNPDGMQADGMTNREIAFLHIRNLADDIQIEAEFIRAVEAIRTAGFKLVCLEPAVPHIWDEHSRGGWKFPVDGLESLINSENGPQLLEMYSGDDATSKVIAREKMLAYFESVNFKGLDGKPDVNQKKTSQQLMETLEALQELNFPFPAIVVKGKFNQEQFMNHLIDWRNQLMSSKIDETLQSDPDGRMIISAGSGHFGYGRTSKLDGTPLRSVNEMLEKLNPSYKSITLNFGVGDPIVQVQTEFAKAIDREKVAHPDLVPAIESSREMMLKSLGDIPLVKISQAANKAGLTKEEFIVPLRKDNDRPCDYFVHLSEQ